MASRVRRLGASAALVALLVATGAGAQAPVPPDVAPAPAPPGGPETVPVIPTAPFLRGIRIGMGDQKADLFSDARFLTLGIRHARLTIGWDALTSPWQVEQLDYWLASARARGVTPLISLGHSRTARRSLPTPERMKWEFRRMRERYPWVTTYATWNEANHCGEPVCHRPKLVASYYRGMRRECPTCTILAPEILDMPNAVAYVKQFRRHLGYDPKRWGLHNYLEANRFKMTRLRAIMRAMRGGDVWLTETGGLVRRNNGSTTDIPEGASHAAEVTRYLFDRVLPANPRIKALYLYHWNAGPASTTWDSGLITPNGRERLSLLVLRRVLRSGLRPGASFRSPAR